MLMPLHSKSSAALQFAHPLPYGAIVHDGGVQFVVFSRSATAMRVLLYDAIEDHEPSAVIHYDPESDRWGDVWSIFMPDLPPGQLYHMQADGPYEPEMGHRFDGTARLIDPYARALSGHFLQADDGIIRPPKCVVIDDDFDWDGDRHLRRNLSETVIYEMHVCGFTRSDTSGVEHPGSYLGIIEKIPYLQSLGVTAIELMPIHEFPIKDFHGNDLKHPNYWGYDPMAFFAPHRGYAVGQEPGSQVHEFKQMVKALHQAGIEVILDVVFNHTCEGNELGPTLSFKGLENRVYYMLENDGRFYRNYSGCGNTINGNHPICREMIFNCLRHWVHNYHVDGFRFDLASILSRDRNGQLVANPPLVEMIGEDPMLADTKIIAEAWDAAGAYQVGTFANLRWAEWNGQYRDDVRSFWRGNDQLRGKLATRLAGSSDLYERGGRKPYHSINFVTSHDGFTLNDLVSYSRKHNEANGEGNRDGDDNNHSANYGIEGPTDQENIDLTRQRQIKNMLATLLVSQGVPMIVAGDECRRTQYGNNNAYCQDNTISWFDWSRVEEHADLVRFTHTLIEFRKAEPTLRRESFLEGVAHKPGELPDVSWYDLSGETVCWDKDEKTLTCLLRAVGDSEGSPGGRHILILFNANDQDTEFVLPAKSRSFNWRLLFNTAAPSPEDIFPDGNGPPLPRHRTLQVGFRSMVCYTAALKTSNRGHAGG